ncbi:MAG TPA: rRNA pseudouridine synthase [Chloroflexi bacterium]|nr:rRNA pseudouridine synthase [Chloroflexota bacterium]
MEIRLQKLLAQAGLGSRRSCEDLIRQGRVRVNGQVAQIGQKADPERDRVTVDGKPVQVAHEHTYIALYKPRGVLSDEGDGSGQLTTVLDLAPASVRLFPVGRLDLRSEGLILLTDDGRLAHQLTHPRYEHPKEYHVRVSGRPSDQVLKTWRQGVFLDGRKTAPAEVSVLRSEKEHTWLRVVLREGRKRQIRRVGAMLGHPVHQLIRMRIGPLRLGGLKPGQWRKLTAQEVAALRAMVRPPRTDTRQKKSRRRR